MEEIINNINIGYEQSIDKKIYIEELVYSRLNITPDINNSIYVWNCSDCIINIKSKCNHLLLYECSNITLNVDDFVSGITCMKSKNCRFSFKCTPTYNIEMSDSQEIVFRSSLFNTLLYYCNASLQALKWDNFSIKKIVRIEIDNMFEDWKFKNLNF